MKRLINILVFCCLSLASFAQDETRVVDSLLNVLSTQQGREKVKTMLELTWDFYDVSFDDCISWGEKAITEAQNQGFVDLEADAMYALGMQYGYHADFDLAQEYLKQAFNLHMTLGKDARAFEDLWNQAYFELLLGNVDSAYSTFQKVLLVAEQRHDRLACAQVIDNLAFIQYQRNDFNGAISSYMSSKTIYESLNDSAAIAKIDMNLATIYLENGRSAEAKKLLVSVIPRLEKYNNYDFLLLAYKNYGVLFENDFVNYDSACYYLQKAWSVASMDGMTREDRQTMTNTKVDVLAELGNVAYARKQYQQAIDYYEEAQSLADSNGYHLGVMQAMNGFGQLYARLGYASKSLQYLESYIDEAGRSGIGLLGSEVRKALILDYARLDRFVEMEKELDILDEQRAALSRENADIYNQLQELRNQAADLLDDHDSQSAQLTTLQTQRNHYRLAFFGLLAIVISAVAVWIFRRILLHNRNRSK